MLNVNKDAKFIYDFRYVFVVFFVFFLYSYEQRLQP